MTKEKRAQKERPKEKMPPHTRMQERHSNGKKKAVYIIRCRCQTTRRAPVTLRMVSVHEITPSSSSY